MDLVGSESRKTGTRGGRSDFTWEAVKEDERQYYLGNTLAAPSKPRLGHKREHDWYTKASTFTSVIPAPPHPTSNTSNSASASAPQDAFMAPASIADDLQIVRKREKAIMERMIVGRSFADAVRSALTESVGSGVDDEGGRDAAAAAARRAVCKKEVVEKAQRKEMRKRVRDLRLVRRTERSRRASERAELERIERGSERAGNAPENVSSESESETIRPLHDERRRRRRRERDSATRRKRSEWTSTSDSDDFDRDRCRRRLR